MAIDMTTPPSEIDTWMEERLSRQQKAILETYKYIGEKCQEEGRLGKTYKDQTGNLRASTGYRVIMDGETFSEGEFESNPGGEAAKEFLDKLSFMYSQEGIVLLVVAGMQYAAAVDAKDYNVITSAELLADQLVPQLMGKFNQEQ